MSREGSGFLLKIVDRLTVLGLQIGGLVFVVLTAYLLWGVYNGNFVYIAGLKGAALTQALAQMHLILRLMLASGMVVLASAAFQFYDEETCGYLMLIGSALLRWGVPALADISQGKVSLSADSVPAHIVAQYVLLGSITMAIAAPLIVYDLWERMWRTRRWLKESTIETVKLGMPKVSVSFFCWQSPNCREHMRAVCESYPKRKSCWRLKSGCYCGEDRLLRLINLTNTQGPQAAQRSAIPRENLTPAQKRARCRECFLYKEHQMLKYKIASPLVFPTVLAIMYFGFKAIWQNLHKALLLADSFSKHISYLPGIGTKGTSPVWANVSASSSAVEWLFVVLLGLVLVTYGLRLVEYLCFELQI